MSAGVGLHVRGGLVESGSDVDRGILETPLFWVWRGCDNSRATWAMRNVSCRSMFAFFEACVAN